MVTPEQELLDSCLFLLDTFLGILMQSFGGKLSCADKTGQQNLRRQFGLLLLHGRFARLQKLPFIRKASERGRERLHLHFQFDALAPEKLASLFLRMLRR
jgi:hypothetical protein